MRTLCLALLLILGGICLAHVQQNSASDGSTPDGLLPRLGAAWRKVVNPSAQGNTALAEENARLRAQLAQRPQPTPGGAPVGSGTFHPTMLDQPTQYVGRWGAQYRSKFYSFNGRWYYSGSTTPLTPEQLEMEHLSSDANQAMHGR